MVTELETHVLGAEDEEKEVKVEEGKCDRYSPALEASEDVKSEVKHEMKVEDGSLPKKGEDSDMKANLKLEAKPELETALITLDTRGTLRENSPTVSSETNSTITVTEEDALNEIISLELSYPSPPRPQAATLPVQQGMEPSCHTIDTKADVKTESDVKVEAGVKAEVESQPSLVKVEAKLEGDDARSNLLKEEEGVKGELKDEPPPATVLDLPQTPTNEDRASIELPDHYVEAAATGPPLDSPTGVAAADPLPDIPAADVDELMYPDIKPEPMDVDLQPVLAPVSRHNLMLCVEPPSLESVMAHYKQRADWAKTIVKKPKKEAVIPLKTLAHRYEALGVTEPFHAPLPIDVRDVAFSRQLISSIYGGNVQQTFPVPSAKFLARHGLNDFMCLNYIMHPNAPELVGAPGFYCSSGSGDPKAKRAPWTKIMRLILQLGPSRWQYYGQYQVVPSDALSPQEWLAQSPGFRRQWVSEIMIRQGWGNEIRCEVLLRKRLGRLPTDEELEDAVNILGFAQEVTPDDIYESFARGDHFIVLWGMKCVGYDTAFQERLVAAKQAAAANEDVKEEKDKKPKVSKRKKRAASDAPKKRARKNSPSDPEGDSKPLDMEVDDDAVEVIEQPSAIVKNDDDDEIQIVQRPVSINKKVYTPRGTRSRPASAKVIVID
ncbi:hypothetical protein BDN71DRAFT_1507643 [Pleurotus eryngii]|uniref:DUF6697 domain-containing protein n=1 Tax=Pleurotus eryngii TaxID=5323 RepID=A0A9P5ZUG6_PLEER|nr:hypothetical protein BDN71DRAFT_1507643 [Pleurotus eryngii]